MSKATSLATTIRAMNDVSGLVNSSDELVKRALALIDPERVSSAPGIVGLFEQTAAAINGDERLSAPGKRGDIAAAARSRMGNLAEVARKVSELAGQHQTERAAAIKIPSAGVEDVLIGLALAQHLKASQVLPHQVERLSEPARLALVRLPAELTGATPAVQSAAMATFGDPVVSTTLAEQAEAIGQARKLVQAAINELAPQAGMEPDQLVKTFGKEARAWSLPGVHASIVERLLKEAEPTEEAA